MSREVRFCHRCGERTVPGASFCAFCGVKLRTDAAEETARSIMVPDRRSLQGPCAVIYAGAREMDVRRIGRMVAETTGMPLPDVTRRMRTSKGFIASGLAPDIAVALAEKIEAELSSPVLVIPEADCVPLPPAMRMRRISIDARGLSCEAYTWDASQKVEARWEKVFLVSCGRLELQEVVEKRNDQTEKNNFVGRPLSSLVTHTVHEYMLDIVLFEPWMRLRLDQNMAAYGLTDAEFDAARIVGPLVRSAVNIERYAADVPMNKGVSLLASGAPDSEWESLTFLNKRDFDQYTYWLMQLVRYGRPIPD